MRFHYPSLFCGDVKTAVMCNKKVIVKVVNKIRNHRETFAFHDNESADQGVVGEAFLFGFGEFRDKVNEYYGAAAPE